MSQTIRTVGVGLLGAEWLAMAYQEKFMSLVAAGDTKINLAYLKSLALQTAAPTIAHMVGADLYFPAIFILGCLGVGLFAAGMVYPFLENAVSALLEVVGQLLSKPHAVSHLLESAHSGKSTD